MVLGNGKGSPNDFSYNITRDQSSLIPWKEITMAIPASKPPEEQRMKRRAIPQVPLADRGLRSISAWSISMLIHVAILVTVGALWASAPKGTGGEKSRPVGIAVVYEASGGEQYELRDAGSSTLGSSDSAAASDAAASNTASTESPPVDVESLLAGLLPSAGGVPGDTGAAAGGLGLGDGAEQLGGIRNVPKVKTTVFGIEGEGTRFLYVFDRSDSMNGYDEKPIAAAKRELIKSLNSLGPAHDFQIIFYNDAPLPYGGVGGSGPKMLRGDEASKRSAVSFVRDISATGGTRHLTALRMAMGMSPDVVFFLTDADQPGLNYREMDDIQSRAARCGATIHAIQFGEGPKRGGENWIQLLASGTNGQYRYVNVSSLDAN